MIGTKRSWRGRAAAAAMAVGLVWATNGAVAAPAVEVVDAGVIVPSANSLLRFYPSQLSSTPAGVVEDKEAWLAKVQGLMAGAPSLLQQSLLMSQSKPEFSANVTLLQQLQKGTLEQSLAGVRSQAKARMTAKDLGDSNNLVYDAVEPCRIMDTRNASLASGVQGPIAGNSLKHIPGINPAGGNWGTYGGTAASDCGLNTGSIWAVAIVITILNPNFDAFLGVGDVNNLATTLSTVALNYTHGQGLSTLYIVPQNSNTIYFAMPTGLSANIIFDLVGIIHLSDATALDCIHVDSAQTPLAAGAGGSATSPACTAGYSLTGGTCAAGNSGVFMVTSEEATNAWFCFSTNTSGSASYVRAEAQCCRVPGR